MSVFAVVWNFIQNIINFSIRLTGHTRLIFCFSLLIANWCFKRLNKILGFLNKNVTNLAGIDCSLLKSVLCSVWSILAVLLFRSLYPDWLYSRCSHVGLAFLYLSRVIICHFEFFARVIWIRNRYVPKKFGNISDSYMGMRFHECAVRRILCKSYHQNLNIDW